MIMIQVLTVNHLCREFVHLLSGALGPIEFSAEPQSVIIGQKQKHLDVFLEPSELAGPMDDLSKRVIAPGAQCLADVLRRDGAAVSFHLDLPQHGRTADLHCAMHRFNGLSVRALLREPRYWPDVPEHESGKYQLRFDVLYRNEAQQAAA